MNDSNSVRMGPEGDDCGLDVIWKRPVREIVDLKRIPLVRLFFRMKLSLFGVLLNRDAGATYLANTRAFFAFLNAPAR